MQRITLAFAVLALAACGGPDPVADGANSFANAEVDVLPPDESVATPTNDLANGAVEAPTESEATAANSTS